MQAIITKFHAGGNRIGARISATANAGRVYIGYPHEISGYEERHRAAADALCDKLNWPKQQLIQAGLPKSYGDGFVFVFKE